MQTKVAARPASPSSPGRSWPTTPLVLLAIALAAVMAWQIRDWSSYLDVRPRSPSLLPAGAGHHTGASGARTPPPAIAARAILNFAGITLLAAHATTASVLLAGAVTRRWATGNIPAMLIFAATSAVLSASATIPLTRFTVGNAISPGNTLSAAITVLQYSFVLSLLVAVALHRRPAARFPEGDRSAEQKRCDQTRFRRRRGTDLSDETAGIRAF
ncbi:hypothetical protein [Amycolatopsis keratiniphila]|uniref:Uncharacterized protein n=1 Tax=Amycolatopsis keratiniphila TaxID=129921 RepID=R4SXD6_9PSEU|nr:hypothetical protein [Amycolatopsis keratiniphila]AGM07999.1 hypothetical protein AORI_5416 [Amycolatopsis keratiniphila]